MSNGRRAVVAADDDAGVELVTCCVDGQEYALPIARVQEIVEAPRTVNEIPHAAAQVLGVVELRGRILPVLSMRRIFGLPDVERRAEHRVVVVAAAGRRVGLLMDAVRAVVQVPREVLTDLPDGVTRPGGTGGIGAVCRLGDGDRLVSVIDLDRLFGGAERLAGLPGEAGIGDDGEGDGMAGFGDDLDDDDEQGDDAVLVVFRLAGERYAVDVDRVQEIIRIPSALIRVPTAQRYLDGLVNLRGSVLPVVDLRTRLGLPRAERDDRQRIVVLTLGGSRTGFLVDAVSEVARVPRAVLEPAPELSAAQAMVVSRVANLPDARMLLVIDADALLPRAGGPGVEHSGTPVRPAEPELSVA